MTRADPAVMYTLKALNSDSGNTASEAGFDGMDKYRVDNGRLFPIIADLRVIKTEEEIEVLRYVAAASSAAHKAVMKKVAPGTKEYQAEATFKNEAYYNSGCRNMAYTCIAASGHHGATLHYGHAGEPNAKLVEDGDMCLFDMGAEYHCYCSDITCSFPANGKFTESQRDVYDTCYEAVVAVESAMRPGVNWADMHRLANRTILAGLLKRGYLINGTVEEMDAVNMGAVFMPHGLGHFLGLDTHDVGGYLKGCPERSTLAGLKSLRTSRDLKAGMVREHPQPRPAPSIYNNRGALNLCVCMYAKRVQVMTIEPGVYWIDHLLDAAQQNPDQAKFLNVDKVNSMRGTGGVRIEDDVVVRADGIENLTLVPRTADDIEAFMAGRPFTPAA